MFDLQTFLISPLKYNKFLRHNILFDTGPLFLYLIGNFDEKEEKKLLDLFDYTKEDYKILFHTIHLLKKSHSNFIITPHILHELVKDIQNKCKKLYHDKNYCDEMLSNISKFIVPILKEIKEIHTEKNELISHTHFLGKLEIGDISLDVVDKFENECSIILSDDKKMIEEYGTEDNKEILLIYFQNIKNNSFLFN